MSTHANMTAESAGAPGTGALTLTGAVAPFRSFGTAYSAANATVAGVRIQDAADETIWEVANNCAYTHSGTTLSRGTFESSSTGSAVNFTGSVVVSVTATADSGRRWDSGALQTVASSADAAVTGVVGQLHALNISGFTANRTFTLPTTFAVDDRIGIVITTGDDAYELLVTAGSGDTLNGVAGGTEWSRLFITGESLVFRATAADTWVIDVGGDGRIPQLGAMSLTGSDITTSSTGWTGLDLDTSDIARGCTVTVSGAAVSTITWRRASYVFVAGSWGGKASSNCADNEQLGWGCTYGGVPGTGTIVFIYNPNHAGTLCKTMAGSGIGQYQIPAGSLLQLSMYTPTTSNLGARALGYVTFMRVQEIL